MHAVPFCYGLGFTNTSMSLSVTSGPSVEMGQDVTISVELLRHDSLSLHQDQVTQSRKRMCDCAANGHTPHSKPNSKLQP